jgi:hypothetical protein
MLGTVEGLYLRCVDYSACLDWSEGRIYYIEIGASMMMNMFAHSDL